MRKTTVCILGLMSLVMTYSLDRIGYKNKYPIVSIGMTSYLYLFCLILVGLIAVAILNKRAYVVVRIRNQSLYIRTAIIQSLYIMTATFGSYI